MKEFKVNEYITLKLEGGKTNIYVKDRLFNQCKFLLLNINEKVRIHGGYIHTPTESIDDLLGQFGFANEPRVNENGKPSIEIPPDDEFWAHCSYLQAWSENNYNTLLISCGLAFPLLKELSKVGDPLAIEVYTKEIKKRFLSQNPFVMIYLIHGLYLRSLNKKDLAEILNKINFNHLKKLAERDIAFYKKIYGLILRITDYMNEFKISGGKEILIKTLIDITNDKRHWLDGVYLIENYIRHKILTKEEQKKLLLRINFNELYYYYKGFSAMPNHIKELERLKDSLIQYY